MLSFNFNRYAVTESVNRKVRLSCIALLALLFPISTFATIEVGIHPDLERKQDSGPPRIEKLTDKVYVARAYDPAQFMFVLHRGANAADRVAGGLDGPGDAAREPTQVGVAGDRVRDPRARVEVQLDSECRQRQQDVGEDDDAVHAEAAKRL